MSHVLCISKQDYCCLRVSFDPGAGKHIQQLLDKINLAAVGSKVKSCVACCVLLVDVCSLGQQPAHSLPVPTDHSILDSPAQKT